MNAFYPIRSGVLGGGALKASPPKNVWPYVFNFGATLLCVGDSSQIIDLHRVSKFFFWMGGPNLAVNAVSKFKVDVLFIILREFNYILEIVALYL